MPNPRRTAKRCRCPGAGKGRGVASLVQRAGGARRAPRAVGARTGLRHAAAPC